MCYPYKRQARKIATLPTTMNLGVYGVACLNDHVFILTHGNEIDIYQKEKTAYNRRKGISTAKLAKPSDIAACSSTCRVFVTDSRSYGLWVISNPMNLNASLEPFVKINKPQGLTVRPDGKLVVITEVPSNICVYESKGNLVCRIPLGKTDIEHPFQAVSISAKSFYICSGLTRIQRHSVTKLSDNGTIEVRNI